MSRLIIVSNRLPFQLVKSDSGFQLKESDGGLVSALKSYFEKTNTDSRSLDKVLWAGSAEFDEKTWGRCEQTRTTPLTYTVEPIYIGKKTYAKFYNGFCNSTIWPLFHYFPSFVEFNNDTFQSYEEVNQLFADQLLKLIKPGDTIWVHDYQLMLLPGMIREKEPEATIGFFLHIPFPSFEVFRMLHRPWKNKVINGLLGADLIGFHTHEYVHHFLNTVQMVFGYDHKFRSISVSDRTIKAEVFPLGIDFEKFNNAQNLEAAVKIRKNIVSSFPDKKIIFSVDRLDYTKGVTHRLLGFERFLELYPEWRTRVVFILIVVPSRQIISKYNERKKLIEEEIGRINGSYSTLDWQPIIYRYNSLGFDELVALYQAADIGLITPLRDGMNLVAKEFVASKKENGVLILSELAGAASELGEAILVNPMDADEVAEAIAQALSIPAEIQFRTISTFQKRLQEYSVTHWVKDFLNQLQEIKSEQVRQQTKLLSQPIAGKMIRLYREASQRLLLLDYDGTLVPYANYPAKAKPDADLLELLNKLSQHAGTDVAIISGRDSQTLNQWFGDLPLTLVSEHGASMRMKNCEWHLDPERDQTWKAFIRRVMTSFCQRSPGSFVEEKHQTMVWHYRNVEEELGFIRSRELIDNLHHLTHNTNLQIIDGSMVIEVRLSGFDKGTVSKRIIDHRPYDFIIAVGDDRTDEDMFQALRDRAHTLKVGTAPTAAHYYTAGHTEVLRLLREFNAT